MLLSKARVKQLYEVFSFINADFSGFLLWK